MFLFARELWFYQNDKQEKLVEEEKNAWEAEEETSYKATMSKTTVS